MNLAPGDFQKEKTEVIQDNFHHHHHHLFASVEENIQITSQGNREETSRKHQAK